MAITSNAEIKCIAKNEVVRRTPHRQPPSGQEGAVVVPNIRTKHPVEQNTVLTASYGDTLNSDVRATFHANSCAIVLAPLLLVVFVWPNPVGYVLLLRSGTQMLGEIPLESPTPQGIPLHFLNKQTNLETRYAQVVQLHVLASPHHDTDARELVQIGFGRCPPQHRSIGE